MLKCEKCSSIVNKENLFCRTCGQKLDENKIIEIGNPKTIFNEAAEADNNSEKLEHSCFKMKSRKSTNGIKVLIVCSIVLVFLIILSYIVKSNLEKNDETNIFNLNTFAHDGKWTYFTYSKFNIQSNNLSGGFYKFSEDNSVPVKFSDEVGGNMKIINDWIYFVRLNDGSYSVYKMKTDGTELTKVDDAKTAPLDFKYSKKYIYFRDSSMMDNLSRMKLDGSSRKILKSDVLNYYINGDLIYYISSAESGILRSMKLDGSSDKVICEIDGPILYINDNYIYYSQINSNLLKNKKNTRDINQYFIYNNGPLYRMRKDGTEKELITEDIVMYIYVRDNQIYYQPYSNGESKKIYKIDLRGKKKIELSLDGFFLGIMDKWIYYIDEKNSMLSRTTLDFKKAQKVESDIFKPQLMD